MIEFTSEELQKLIDGAKKGNTNAGWTLVGYALMKKPICPELAIYLNECHEKFVASDKDKNPRNREKRYLSAFNLTVRRGRPTKELKHKGDEMLNYFNDVISKFEQYRTTLNLLREENDAALEKINAKQRELEQLFDKHPTLSDEKKHSLMEELKTIKSMVIEAQKAAIRENTMDVENLFCKIFSLNDEEKSAIFNPLNPVDKYELIEKLLKRI